MSVDYAPPLVLGAPNAFTTVTDKLSAYNHTILAVGGFWDARITLTATEAMIEDWYENGLGRHITTFNANQTPAWEGFVNQVSISFGGLSVTRGPLMEVRNKVKVVYSTVRYNTNPPIGGQSTETPWVSDTASQALYGILEEVLSGGQMADAESLYVRGLYLAENAYPKGVGDLSVGAGAEAATITLECLGYVHWFNAWHYTASGTGTQTASAKVNAVIAADPNGFAQQGNPSRVSTNSITVPVVERDDRTAWTVLKDLVTRGDGADNRWLLGMYENRIVHYNAIPTTLDYQYRLRDPGQEVYTVQGVRVAPWDMRPGKWLYRLDFLVGRTPDPTLQQDPRAQFVEAVEYTAPFGLQLKGGRVDRLAQRLARLGLGGLS